MENAILPGLDTRQFSAIFLPRRSPVTRAARRPSRPSRLSFRQPVMSSLAGNDRLPVELRRHVTVTASHRQ